MIGRPGGFWSEFGAPASVDWCEPNYVITPYVAEFWNTATGVLILIAGLVGVRAALRATPRAERRFALAFLGMAVVGLGTAAFHGTLLKLPQAADELPMVWLGLLFVYCLRFRTGGDVSTQRRWRIGLTAYAAAFTAAYFALESYFVFFLGTYALIVAFIVARSWTVAYRRQRGDQGLTRLFWIAAGAYLGGLVTMWIPERSLPCAHPFQALQPHALFHLTSLVGTYAWIVFARVDRAACRASGDP